MTRIFGRAAEAAGVASRVCACAVSTAADDPKAVAAAAVEPASNSLRRLKWCLRTPLAALVMIALSRSENDIGFPSSGRLGRRRALGGPCRKFRKHAVTASLS